MSGVVSLLKDAKGFFLVSGFKCPLERVLGAYYNLEYVWINVNKWEAKTVEGFKSKS